MEASINLGSSVSFKLGQTMCRNIQEIASKVTDALEVTGKVTFFSDSGHNKSQFAIVSVQGIDTPVIVPVSQLKTLDAKVA